MDWNATIGTATVALVGITGYYAWVTHRLLLENARANAFQREGFERQMEAALRPLIFCALGRSTSKVALTVANASHQPAFDVDLWLLAVMNADEIPLNKFAERFVGPEDRNKVAALEGRLVDESFYCVFNRLVYPVFPPRQQVTIPFAPPVPSDGYYLLLKFRDCRGANYAQTYWWLDAGDKTRYALGAIDPHGLAQSPRIDFDVTSDSPKLSIDDRKRLPPNLLKDFEPMFLASLSSGFAPPFAIGFGVEDVGRWTSL